MRSFQHTRSGFAMIMAIFFMIVIATLLSYMLSSTTETAKRTTNTYVNEQAQLLAKSATEYAILRVSGIPRTVAAPCLLDFSSEYYGQVPDPSVVDPLFDIKITVNYFGFTDACAPLFVDAAFPNKVIGSIDTPESNGTMMIDVYVTNNPNGLKLSEPIRYHRRTLQKL